MSNLTTSLHGSASYDTGAGSYSSSLKNENHHPKTSSSISMNYIGSSMLFSDVVKTLNEIRALKGTGVHVKKERKVERLFMKFRSHPIDSNAPLALVSLFPVARLLLPGKDRKRQSYGLKQKVLAAIYKDVLSIAPGSVTASFLDGWDDPERAVSGKTGDFGGIVCIVAQHMNPVSVCTVTVADVNSWLDRLASAHSKRDRDDKRAVFKEIVAKCTPAEQEWIVKLALKDLKVSISDRIVLTAIHPDASALFDLKSDLKAICDELLDPCERANARGVELFSLISPMLAESVNLNKVAASMASNNDRGDMFVETKLDGERFLLHKRYSEYRYFSRNMKEHTKAFGASPSEGSLTPRIHELFQGDVYECILDGEMMMYDPVSQTVLTKEGGINKNDVKNVAHATAVDNPKLQYPFFSVFDILFINGKATVVLPLEMRRKILKDVFKQTPHIMELVEQRLACNTNDLINELNRAIDHGEEGVMVKNPASLYLPNERSKKCWIKLKPDYVDSLQDDLDVVIVGGLRSESIGLRSGLLSHFLCAVGQPEDDGSLIKWVTCGKVGTGYSAIELASLNDRLRNKFHTYDPSRPPSFAAWPVRFGTILPHKWIHPRDSIVISIKVASLAPNVKDYVTEFTFRFPRCMGFRYDKPINDAMTLAQFHKLGEDGIGLSNGRVTSQHLHTSSPKKKRRKTERSGGVARVPQHMKAADTSQVSVICNIFAGSRFFVVSGTPYVNSETKEALEKLIVSLGGFCVQSASLTGGIDGCIAGFRNAQEKGIERSEAVDIIKPRWLFDCLTNGHRIPLHPKYMVWTTAITAAEFSKTMNKWGDSWTEDSTPESLRECFKLIEEGPTFQPLTCHSINELIEDNFPTVNFRNRIFRHVVLFTANSDDMLSTDIGTTTKEYSIDNDWDEDCLGWVSGLVCFYGAISVDSLDETVTHVLVAKPSEGDLMGVNHISLRRLVKVRRIAASLKRQPHVVPVDWFYQSVAAGRVLTERELVDVKLPETHIFD